MRRKNHGCCFLFVCLLFLLPGIYLIRDKLPDWRTVMTPVKQVRGRIEQLLNDASEPEEMSEEQKGELLNAGTEENGCAYYYWLLDDQLRLEYMKILNGFQDMNESIDLLLDEDSMKQVMQMLFADHPEVFWVDQSYEYTIYDSWVQIHPDYNCSKEEKEQRSQLVEQTVQEGLQSIPENASAYECIKALYTYVVNTVEYNMDSTDNQNIYSSMVNRVSVCTGYAKELQYLMQRRGIQALCVAGTVENGGPHAWVIGNCDGQYYHIDPTFGDPSYMEEAEAGSDPLPAELQVDYAYLCCDTETILRGRTISEDLEVPDCQATDLLYYPMHGLYFTAYDDSVLISLQDSIDSGSTCWEGQFADESSYQQMITAMQDGVFANLVLANHPDWGSVRINMGYRNESLVVKLWY